MATTDELLKDARALGEKIATHDAAKKFEEAVKALRDDADAQRLLNDHNRAIMAVAEKEQKGEPVEVEDKRKLEDLQKKVVSNRTLRQLQMAQMDYVDLMRQVDQAMSGSAAPEDAPADVSPLINPGAAPQG